MSTPDIEEHSSSSLIIQSGEENILTETGLSDFYFTNASVNVHNRDALLGALEACFRVSLMGIIDTGGAA
jgi:hypothetical protein